MINSLEACGLVLVQHCSSYFNDSAFFIFYVYSTLRFCVVCSQAMYIFASVVLQ